jgi:hypothetical protein
MGTWASWALERRAWESAVVGLVLWIEACVAAWVAAWAGVHCLWGWTQGKSAGHAQSRRVSVEVVSKADRAWVKEWRGVGMKMSWALERRAWEPAVVGLML